MKILWLSLFFKTQKMTFWRMYECLFCSYNEMTLGPKAVLTKKWWTISFRSINATTKSLLVQGNYQTIQYTYKLDTKTNPGSQSEMPAASFYWHHQVWYAWPCQRKGIQNSSNASCAEWTDMNIKELPRIKTYTDFYNSHYHAKRWDGARGWQV